MNNLQAPVGKVRVVGIVRDKYGRIVLDEQVFHDRELLEQIRQEVLKNGSDTLGHG